VFLHQLFVELICYPKFLFTFSERSNECFLSKTFAKRTGSKIIWCRVSYIFFRTCADIWPRCCLKGPCRGPSPLSFSAFNIGGPRSSCLRRRLVSLWWMTFFFLAIITFCLAWFFPTFWLALYFIFFSSFHFSIVFVFCSVLLSPPPIAVLIVINSYVSIICSADQTFCWLFCLKMKWKRRKFIENGRDFFFLETKVQK